MTTTLLEAVRDYNAIVDTMPKEPSAEDAQRAREAYAAVREAQEREEADDTDRRAEQLRDLSPNDGAHQEAVVTYSENLRDQITQVMTSAPGSRQLIIQPPDEIESDSFRFEPQFRTDVGGTTYYRSVFHAPKEFLNTGVFSNRALFTMHDAPYKQRALTTASADFPVFTEFYGEWQELKQYTGPLVNPHVTDHHYFAGLHDVVMPFQKTFSAPALKGEGEALPKTEFTSGETTLGAYLHGGITQVSHKFTQSLYVNNFLGIIGQDLARQIGRQQNAAFTKGDGSSKTKGILPSIIAYQTLAQFTKDSSGNAFAATIPQWLDLRMKLDPDYRVGSEGARAVFMCSSEVASKFHTLQSANNFVGMPYFNLITRLDQTMVPFAEYNFGGYDVVSNPDMETSTGSNKSVMLYGDMKSYRCRFSDLVIERTNIGGDAWSKHMVEIKATQYSDGILVPEGAAADQNGRKLYGPVMLAKTTT